MLNATISFQPRHKLYQLQLSEAPQLNSSLYFITHPQECHNATIHQLEPLCIQTCLRLYLIVLPYVYDPTVPLVNYRGLPVHSAHAWRDTWRADLPLACSQHQPRICSLFFPIQVVWPGLDRQAWTTISAHRAGASGPSDLFT